jgi:hypothetical protein
MLSTTFLISTLFAAAAHAQMACYDSGITWQNTDIAHQEAQYTADRYDGLKAMVTEQGFERAMPDSNPAYYGFFKFRTTDTSEPTVSGDALSSTWISIIDQCPMGGEYTDDTMIYRFVLLSYVQERRLTCLQC